MKKSVVIATALMSAFLLTACGSQSSSSSKQSNKSVAKSSSSKKQSAASSSSSSLKQSASSSSNSSAKASSTAKTTKVDDKTAGVMLMLLVEPDYLKQYIGNDYFCYSPAGENPINDATAADYSYLTANGDPTSFLYYKVDGNTVTYKMWMVSDSRTVADGHFETKTVSLSTLENDYYVTQSQKDEVNSYVSQLKSESDYLNQNK
ncbi:Lreu_0056 family protein [Limosilactobacillus fermentum]|nr:hypothetical protein [Limosilactobacillus fermentum]